MSLHLSRIRLKHAPSAAALARVLLPEDEEARVGASHRLVWSLFADTPDRTRDFLWREDGGSTWQRTTFLVLSARPPADEHGLFELESKPFAPALEAGQRLGFRLRASPSANQPREPGQRGKRIDPLAKVLTGLSKQERAEHRHRVTQEVGAAWLARQGARAGFRLAEEADGEGEGRSPLHVDGDRWRVIPRERGARPVRFPSLDFEGTLSVGDPALFLAGIAQGFGRAKAFGCGLMLIRRV